MVKYFPVVKVLNFLEIGISTSYTDSLMSVFRLNIIFEHFSKKHFMLGTNKAYQRISPSSSKIIRASLPLTESCETNHRIWAGLNKASFDCSRHNILSKRFISLPVFDLQSMKLPIFFLLGLYAHNQPAESMARDSIDLISSQIRHWAMPNSRQMGTTEVEKKFVKQNYNRLSQILSEMQ